MSMKKSCFIPISLWISCTALYTDAQETRKETAQELVAGTSVTWTFPDLPQTLWSEALGIKKVPAATLWLPVDYTPEKTYPLLLFMGGAQGDSGHRADHLKAIAGESGVIYLSLPLFHKNLDPLREDERNKWKRLYLGPEQADYIWKAHKVMLEKVFSSVPGIQRDFCFIGGFSNGAHTVAIEFNLPEAAQVLRSYFSHIILVEGGHLLRPSAYVQGCQILLLQGGEKEPWLTSTAEVLRSRSEAKVTLRSMPGTGHSFPPQEKRWVGNWIRSLSGLKKLAPETEQ